MPRTSSAKERILDAYEEILIAEGSRSATLDAVAAKAGVSKGGLLYHFGSRDALADGLLDRFVAVSAEDVKLMSESPEGPSAYYIKTSVNAEGSLDRAILAALRLGAEYQSKVRESFTDLQAQWFGLLQKEFGDPALARAIMLMGDGLYYNASLHGLDATDGQEVGQLLDVIDRLRTLGASGGTERTASTD